MGSFESSLYSAATALCIFAAGILRGGAHRRWSPSWLSWFLLIEAGVFALELAMAHPAMPLKGLWLGLRLGSSLLIAPCLWLAVRELATGVRPRLTGLGRGPLLAIAVGFILTVPLIEDAHWGVTYGNPDRVIGWLHARFIHATMLGCVGIFAVQAPWFLWRCRMEILGLAQMREESVRWLQLPLLVVATTWVLGLLRTLQCATHAPRELAVALALTDVGVTVGAVYVLMRRMPLQVTEEEPVVEPPAPPAKTESPTISPVVQYARSPLDPATRKRVRGKIERALAQPELCRDSLLNLQSFSRGIGEKAHYVSQVINQDMGGTFLELVNRRRIELAQQLLRNVPERTVLEIALEVGFNSKSTFNTAFRKHTGVTPSDFRAERGT